MTTGSLLVVDLLIAVLVAAAWLGAGATAAAGRVRAALGLTGLALVATAVRALTIGGLARAGWWFAAEKVVVAAPLLLAGTVVAVIALLRDRAPVSGTGHAVDPSGRRLAPVALLFAGYTSAASLLVSLLHGYPVSGGVALFAVAGVAAATAVTWRTLGTRPSPVMSRAAVVVAVGALVAGTALATAGGATSTTQHQHNPATEAGAAAASYQHEPLPPAGKAASGPHRKPLTETGKAGSSARHEPVSGADVNGPTRRFTLTAGTARIEAGGAEVDAWAFNGQVPGPEIAATVGDLIEVTLRNRDIDRGVTLHWHGYDVPNDQDGVPGVTQDAVLPGREFVYRFRADQAGTYWYHTHSVSDVGVRMGLYGVLVVRPRPAGGVEVTVPVHTLAGHLLPAPAVATAAPGTPVRLRLINTDDTTHRYAVTGAPFHVAAIDGVDLRGPSPLSERALLIPAGGRYDVVTTAPAALSVDGREVWSTGTPSAGTADWPVFDPLAYGTTANRPWSRFDRSFTLVLDRGLDLRGLLPRYAHTVNGAAAPDIPAQTVRDGDVVKFTIVNRSLVAHPWHLHGHHVLVLARDGRPATGSPLWLDSFDVRPGEVWEVAFEADNPGVWANHCHNLPHADAGMMLHLAYE
ncbi:multicopper oxidase family protein [Paractinoplanes brasiliensis]|uniref:FtsP/CotA-like multicopper oxidase with cupredoxin domain n=1 Tax=Paractinoplanes brasiliensis TaxID=52695 RepID=A0A4R6JC58_9ACTN|nr:multicopper oxidase family protein [Actinoplanes brasiliensis]TDO32511.1 FtsP/CotA-like multicopper oxidase with cupredoxin domain [Actinoplanes brasiliensis]GID27614.1 hypothetical protein Abr02nite_25970 [Actinoplanes brasiliensis]